MQLLMDQVVLLLRMTYEISNYTLNARKLQDLAVSSVRIC